MSDRILGPSESRRRGFWRYRLILLPVVAIAAVAFFITNASAVHDLGLFQLDRNAQDPPATAGDDWNTPPKPTGGAEVFTGIVPDVSGADQFQAGGSKDNNDINQWLWKAGEPLDKDDITDAYAAGYINDTVDTGLNNLGDFIIYFGLDRFANDGSAQVGFWFFKNEISTTDIKSGGGFQFSGVHTAGTPGSGPGPTGDILVQSNFSQGGVISTINVYEWVGSGGSNGSLDLIGTAGDCLAQNAPADDPACATVNQVSTPSPWAYTPKSGPPNFFPPGSFFEGGINVTRLLGGGGGATANCFSTFAAETRSSTPFDSRLKDFVLHSFPTCSVDVDTLATPTGGGVTPGTSVTDTATVTGQSLVGTAPRPAGRVKFFLCDPDDVAANLADPNHLVADCATGGTQVGDPLSGELLVNGAGASDSTATSDATTNTNDVGKYCWRAEYVPATGSPYAAKSFTNATDECFTIVAAPTTTTTRQFVYPQDKALITPPASGGDPTGTVTFKLFDSLVACNGTAVPPIDPVYTEANVPLTTTAPFTAKTNNNPDNAESYAITDGTTHYWKASFDSTNNAQLDSESACVESTDVTFVGDDASINVPDEPPSP